MEEFKVGEYIIYANGYRYELGRIKRLTEDGAFICYHEGETAAKTPYHLIHKLVNGFTIKETTIGGETFKESEGKQIAIETMCKYQKIEDIYYHQTGRALEDSLRSVIEERDK